MWQRVRVWEEREREQGGGGTRRKTTSNKRRQAREEIDAEKGEKRVLRKQILQNGTDCGGAGSGMCSSIHFPCVEERA